MGIKNTSPKYLGQNTTVKEGHLRFDLTLTHQTLRMLQIQPVIGDVRQMPVGMIIPRL